MTMRVFTRVQELGRRKELKEIHQLDSCHQTHGFPVRRNIGDNCQETRVQWYQFVSTVHHQLVQGNCQEVGMASMKEGQIRRQLFVERFVERNSKGSLTRQFQENERANVHQSNLCGITTALVHKKANRDDDFVNIASGENVIHEKRILFQELPEQDQEFLVAFELGASHVSGFGFVAITQQASKSIKQDTQFLSRLDTGQQGSENVEAALGSHFKFDTGIPILVHYGFRSSRQSTIQQNAQYLRRKFHQLDVAAFGKSSGYRHGTRIVGNDGIEQRVKETRRIGGICRGSHRQPTTCQGIVFVSRGE
mmetsp:Transcript_12862/g.24733  ORF Transcript_12862/g.24733 Transcript_12862/m.24733 type:complete len:308 (-) Transcript_12862:463-1386(-)